MAERKEKFKPGPWKYDPRTNEILNDNRYPIAEYVLELENGNLIAAAPEMYAIVSKLEKWHIADDAKEEDVEMLLRKAAKVAKKARGEE